MPYSSPAPPGDAPTPAPSSACSRILSGYRHTDFPDLSSRRFAPDALHSASRPLHLGPACNTSALHSTIVAALARVLGAYCGCQDILLGLAPDDEDRILPVRVTWADGQTWESTAARIAEALADPFWPRVHPNELRRALDSLIIRENVSQSRDVFIYEVEDEDPGFSIGCFD